VIGFSYLHTHNGPIRDLLPASSLDEGRCQLMVTPNRIEIRSHRGVLVEVAALRNHQATIRIVCGPRLSAAVILKEKPFSTWLNKDNKLAK